MKKLNKLKLMIIAIASLIFFIWPAKTLAQTEATPSSGLKISVEKIKETVASQTAVVEKSKQIFKGTVTKINKEERSFTLSGDDQELTAHYLTSTKFYWQRSTGGGKLVLTFSNIEINDNLIIIGNYLPGDNEIDAELIIGREFQQSFFAQVDKIGKNSNFDIHSLNSENTYSLTVKPTTVIKSLTKTGFEEAKIQDLKEKTVFFVIGRNDKDAKTFSPSKIMIISQNEL